MRFLDRYPALKRCTKLQTETMYGYNEVKMLEIPMQTTKTIYSN